MGLFCTSKQYRACCPPTPRPPVAYNCCVSVFIQANSRIDPRTQQLIGDICTCRYASTTATGWYVVLVAGFSMLYMVNSNPNHCLLSELPPASTSVRLSRAAAVAHPLEFEVSRCRTSQFARSFLPAQVRMWNDLPNVVFDTRTLDGFVEFSSVARS